MSREDERKIACNNNYGGWQFAEMVTTLWGLQEVAEVFFKQQKQSYMYFYNSKGVLLQLQCMNAVLRDDICVKWVCKRTPYYVVTKKSKGKSACMLIH